MMLNIVIQIEEILYSRNKELTKSIFSQFGVVIK